ncbi:hypothetical protein BH10BAC2_BH10BAC2_42950 [soil metagenome]
MKKQIFLFFFSTITFSSIHLIAQTSWYTAGNLLTANGVLGSNNNFGLYFKTNNKNVGALTPAGNWGIGTTTPLSRLHVVNSSLGIVYPNANSPLVVENNANNYISVLAPAANERGILFGDPADPSDGGIIYNGANNELQFRTNGNITRMILKQDGKLGIGTLTPAYLLDVAGRMRIQAGGGTAGVWFSNAANTSDVAFAGMVNDSYVGLFGGGSGWGFLMNVSNGNTGIGTASPAYKLDVCGTIRSKEILVQTGWCDYVFEKDYKLLPLSDVEKFIKTYRHLPDVTPGSEIETNGLEVGKVSSEMIRKIEELTLYIIEQEKAINDLKEQNQKLETKMNSLIKKGGK